GESEAKAKTKARFEELFKTYTDLPAHKKKSRKKSTRPEENIVLETLKKSLDLNKETEDDDTILKNTYNPEQGSPRYTKNKLREKINNNGLVGEERKPPKTKKKKEKTEAIENEGLEINDTETRPRRKKLRSTQEERDGAPRDEVDTEDEKLIKEYQQQIAEVEENAIRKKLKKKIAQKMLDSAWTEEDPAVLLNNEAEKRKKKKLKTTETEPSSVPLSELQDSQLGEGSRTKQKKQRVVSSDAERESLDAEEEGITESKEAGGQKSVKGKKRRKKKEFTEDVGDGQSEAQQSHLRHSFDDSLVLGVYIHRTDRLKTDLMVSHPMVKVHVIDETTGKYVRKENSKRPVSSFYEDEKVEHILPIMTQPYDFKKNKSTMPEWEEQIVFNERFGYFLQENEESPKVILFFEVLDFMSMDEARASFEVDRHERGFRKIAWAFLKLVGTNGVLNVDGKLRLQLYCPPPRGKTLSNTVEVFEWWKKYSRNRYLSTLYVTVKGLKLPDHVRVFSHSLLRKSQERGSTTYSELQSELLRKGASQLLDEKRAEILKWSRMPGQVCRIPNKPLLCFRGGQMGCFAVRFSHNGRTLATACADRDGYPIVVYEIPSGKVLGAFNGHLSIVYDLCWSRDDTNLLSASSDGTVRIWNIETLKSLAEKVLPHPAFIYAARYHPSAQHLVVTGGYDCVIRVWNVTVKDINGHLLHEFDGHKSFINTLCFDSEGLRMFSGDSSGLVVMWNTAVKEGSKQNPTRQWCIEKEIKDSELEGIPINHLEVHPNGRRLLIHAKDSIVRVMDLRILVFKKYTGATNYREKIHSTFTPCGSFIFSGSEDGMAFVWNAETGDQVAVYSELCYPSPLRDVDFHPHEHMVAFCAFGQGLPVHVYLYDRKVAQMEAESMKRPAGSMSKQPKIFSSTNDASALQDSSVSSIDHFASSARASLRLQQVKQKLDSVLEPVSRNLSAAGYLYDKQGGVPSAARDLPLEAGFVSPVSSSYFNTVGSNLLLPAPSLLSPHSKVRLPSSLGAQLIPQQSLTSQSRFSTVGRHLSHAPSLRLQTSFADPSTSFLRVEADSFVPVQQTVVSLYDYTANRSDELTIHRGDIIQVLYKDNENWWFGRLANGQQGYFPANYVADERGFEEELSHTLEPNPVLSDQQNETADRSPTPAKMSAAVSYSGELKFISEHDTDTDSPVTTVQKKKKKLKKKSTEGRSEAPAVTDVESSQTVTAGDAAAPTASVRKKRSKTSAKTIHKGGQANSAFEPDC
ncbi:AHI1 protein, partial [Atractosteus spatula]|nr:AHI1 protein [Atractosteus spatula]